MEAGRVRQAVVVLPADMLNAITTAWFKTLLRGSMLVPHERIRFGGPEGVGTGPRFGTVVCYVGSRQLRFARVFGGRGVILRPWTVPGPKSPTTSTLPQPPRQTDGATVMTATSIGESA
jgi:hypothetical protein